MSFDEIRKLKSVERDLRKRISQASEQLADGRDPGVLERGFNSGRGAPRHPMWPKFLRFAAPVHEAAEHIEWQRRGYEEELEAEITASVETVRRKKKA